MLFILRCDRFESTVCIFSFTPSPGALKSAVVTFLTEGRL
jgi:hypothetical protein